MVDARFNTSNFTSSSSKGSIHGTGTNSSLSSTKQHAGDEGAISEQMRLKHIKEMREKEEKEKAKRELEEKKALFERNKIDINHREIEIRRLQAEATRAESLSKSSDNTETEWQEKLSKQKTQVFKTGEEIQKAQLALQQLKNKQDKETVAMNHLQAELDYKKKEKGKSKEKFEELETKRKREASEAERLRGLNIRLESEIRRLEQKVR